MIGLVFQLLTTWKAEFEEHKIVIKKFERVMTDSSMPISLRKGILEAVNEGEGITLTKRKLKDPIVESKTGKKFFYVEDYEEHINAGLRNIFSKK